MELPTHEEFGKLRLGQFATCGVRALKDWEYLEELWVGEAIGFTEVLRLARDPKVVRSVAVDLVELPARVQTRLLEAVGVPLCRGMTLSEITALLGKPQGASMLVPDRATYEFRIGTRWRYRVSCTIRKKVGLIYFTMVATTRTKLAGPGTSSRTRGND
jgi:hypothetical protein